MINRIPRERLYRLADRVAVLYMDAAEVEGEDWNCDMAVECALSAVLALLGYPQDDFKPLHTRPGNEWMERVVVSVCLDCDGSGDARKGQRGQGYLL